MLILILNIISATTAPDEQVSQPDRAQLWRRMCPSMVLEDGLIVLPAKTDKINSLPCELRLMIMGFLAPVIIPKNVRSEIITQALNALAIVLRRFQLSVFFGPTTFQQIFSAHNLLNELSSGYYLEDYRSRLLGNLGFSIYYKKCPELRIDRYCEMRKFMDEPGRQSVLEHFANVYSGWPPEQKDEFISSFVDICDDIKTVQLARKYYNVLGERAKNFFVFAMLKVPFTKKKVNLYGITHPDVEFLNFFETPKDDAKRKTAWTANRILIAKLSHNTRERNMAYVLNDIELGDVEAIMNINIEILCILFELYQVEYNLLFKWINLIWSKLGLADAEDLVKNSPIPLNQMPLLVCLTLAPRRVFQMINWEYWLDDWEQNYIIRRVINSLSDFSSSEMKDEFEKALLSLIKDSTIHRKNSSMVVAAALYFCLGKENPEIIDSLLAYIPQNPRELFEYLRYQRASSPAWTGHVVIFLISSTNDYNMTNVCPVLTDWVISCALLRNDEAFLHKLNVPASQIIKIAYECGAIPLWYSEEQLQMTILPYYSEERLAMIMSEDLILLLNAFKSILLTLSTCISLLLAMSNFDISLRWFLLASLLSYLTAINSSQILKSTPASNMFNVYSDSILKRKLKVFCYLFPYFIIIYILLMSL